MIPPPNDATDYPADYLNYLRQMKGDEYFGKAVLFSGPKDPGSVIAGPQGTENFWWSVVIGFLDPDRRQFKILLRYDWSRNGDGNKVWEYCISDKSEFDIVELFSGMDDLLSYLKSGSWF